MSSDFVLSYLISVWSCEGGWYGYTGSCYIVTPTILNHEQAKESCEEKNASLVDISSREENSFVASLVPGSVPVWIGYSDKKLQGTFVWDKTGKQGTYTNWRSNQPDNWNGNEDCVEIRNDEKWNDVQCDVSYQAICKTGNAGLIFS